MDRSDLVLGTSACPIARLLFMCFFSLAHVVVTHTHQLS
jgi:hypothetical protein